MIIQEINWEIEFVQEIEVREIEIQEISIQDIEIQEVAVREIEFGILICNPTQCHHKCQPKKNKNGI